MDWRYVEGKSGSRANPPRYGVWPSCSPQRRRCRHDDSISNAGPWRRLHDDSERAWAGFDPSDRFSPRTRPAGRVGRGLRPVGPMAAEGRGGRFGGTDGAGSTPPAGSGPFRPCAGPTPHRCLHPSRHTPSGHQPFGSDPYRPAMVVYPAASGAGDGHMDRGDQADTSGRCASDHDYTTLIPCGHTDQAPRATGGTALPHPLTVGRGAEEGRGEP